MDLEKVVTAGAQAIHACEDSMQAFKERGRQILHDRVDLLLLGEACPELDHDATLQAATALKKSILESGQGWADCSVQKQRDICCRVIHDVLTADTQAGLAALVAVENTDRDLGGALMAMAFHLPTSGYAESRTLLANMRTVVGKRCRINSMMELRWRAYKLQSEAIRTKNGGKSFGKYLMLLAKLT